MEWWRRRGRYLNDLSLAIATLGIGVLFLAKLLDKPALAWIGPLVSGMGFALAVYTRKKLQRTIRKERGG